MGQVLILFVEVISRREEIETTTKLLEIPLEGTNLIKGRKKKYYGNACWIKIMGDMKKKFFLKVKAIFFIKTILIVPKSTGFF